MGLCVRKSIKSRLQLPSSVFRVISFSVFPSPIETITCKERFSSHILSSKFNSFTYKFCHVRLVTFWSSFSWIVTFGLSKRTKSGALIFTSSGPFPLFWIIRETSVDSRR
ncbi:hypothetical protein Hanom_Chr06g00482921 [Helianthus anomalus]